MDRGNWAMDKIFTFYFNNTSSETGIWSCVAASQDQAFEKADRRGLRDFFLSEVRDVPEESIRVNVLSTLLENPILGQLWLPIAEAFESLSEGLTEKSSVWVVNTLLRSRDYASDDSPYVQAILGSDGSLHIEVAGKLAITNMSDEDLRLLRFIGWSVPDLEENELNKEPGLPNPFRVFDVGWGALQVAAFALETLIAVYGLQEDDYFDFTSAAFSSSLAEKGHLERAGIHAGNPDGTLFRLIQPEGR